MVTPSDSFSARAFQSPVKSPTLLPMGATETRASLRLDGYRVWTTWASIDAASRKQLAEYRYLLEESEEFEGPIEHVDVVDTRDGKATYQLFLWPFGSGVLLHAGTARVVADVVQHGFVVHEPDGVPAGEFGALREAVGAAFKEGQERLGIKEGVTFGETLAEKARRAPAPPAGGEATGSVDERIAELRRDAAEGKPPPDKKTLQALVSESLGPLITPRTQYRPFPVRRLFELTPGQRNALELMVDLKADNAGFPRHGLPAGTGIDPLPILSGFGYWRETANDLARFLRRAPLLPLDELIEVDGQSHPAWTLVSDALYGFRSLPDVVEILVGSLPPDRLLALWEALFKTTQHDLRGRCPPTAAEDSKGQSGASIDAHTGQFIELLVSLNLRLGEAGHARAEELVAGLEKMTARPDHFEVVAGLECLAARGEVDPGHDRLLANAVMVCVFGSSDWRMVGPFTHLLEKLPPDRVGPITGIHMPLIDRFPSAGAAARLIARLEDTSFTAWTGPYFDKAFRKTFVDSLGELAKPALTEAVARSHPRGELLADCLARIEKKGSKKPKKK